MDKLRSRDEVRVCSKCGKEINQRSAIPLYYHPECVGEKGNHQHITNTGPIGNLSTGHSHSGAMSASGMSTGPIQESSTETTPVVTYDAYAKLLEETRTLRKKVDDLEKGEHEWRERNLEKEKELKKLRQSLSQREKEKLLLEAQTRTSLVQSPPVQESSAEIAELNEKVKMLMKRMDKTEKERDELKEERDALNNEKTEIKNMLTEMQKEMKKKEAVYKEELNNLKQENAALKEIKDTEKTEKLREEKKQLEAETTELRKTRLSASASQSNDMVVQCGSLTVCCPSMTLDKRRVNKDLQVSTDEKQINNRKPSGQHHEEQFNMIP